MSGHKNGGAMGTSGSSLWALTQRGVVRIPESTASEERLFDVAVGAGAEDVRLEDDQWVVTTRREEDHDDVQNVYVDFELSDDAILELA